MIVRTMDILYTIRNMEAYFSLAIAIISEMPSEVVSAI